VGRPSAGGRRAFGAVAQATFLRFGVLELLSLSKGRIPPQTMGQVAFRRSRQSLQPNQSLKRNTKSGPVSCRALVVLSSGPLSVSA
jgi:hypothetical protein